MALVYATSVLGAQMVEGLGVAVVVAAVVLAALASSVVKKGTGPEIAPTQALEEEQGVVGAEEVVGVEEGVGAEGEAVEAGDMGVEEGAMAKVKATKVAAGQAVVLPLEHATNVVNLGIGPKTAQPHSCQQTMLVTLEEISVWTCLVCGFLGEQSSLSSASVTTICEFVTFLIACVCEQCLESSSFTSVTVTILTC